MKKQWRKACITVLTIGLLALGVAGCSGGTIFGIQIGGSDEKSNEEFDFSQLTNKYPIPDPIRTPEEIKAAGGEVTVEDVENAFEYFTYKVATDILGESEVVSSKFISITPGWYPRRINSKSEKVYEPFYALVNNDRYYISLNLVLATANMEMPFEDGVYVSKDFAKVLEVFGAKKTLIAPEYLRQFKDYRFAEFGDYAYDDITIDLTKIDELEPAEREFVVSFLYDLSQDVEKLYENHNSPPLP